MGSSRFHSDRKWNAAVLLSMESWRRSCQMRLCYGEASCFIPTPLKCDTQRDVVLSLLRSEPSTDKSLMATHRLKCSMIFSSRTFSGKFPTHKCLVSRTILCAPAPLSCRWVFSVSFSLCKMKKICKFYTGQEKGKNPRRKSLTGRCDPV